MPNLQFGKPDNQCLTHFANRHNDLPFSYQEVGDSETGCPSGYSVDRTSITLGEGNEVFDLARQALQKLDHLRLGWVEGWSPSIKKDELVIISARAFGLWWLNPCRIVYVSNPDRSKNEFAFAYGTLPGHVERGEERFRVKWDEVTNQVTFDILAFSRPNHLLSYFGYPMVRRLQKKFGYDCASKLFRLINPENEIPAIKQVND